MKVEQLLIGMMEEALRSFHRRLLVVYGRESEEVLAYIVFKHFTLKAGGEEKVVYVSSDDASNYNVFIKRLEEKSYPIGNVKLYTYKETHRLMGTTNDILILDMSVGARPNDMGRLIETVRGGGLVIFYNLDLNAEKPWSTSLHKKLISPPYGESDMKARFEKYFTRKILEDQSIWILDGWNIIRGNMLNPPTSTREKPSPPNKSRIPRAIYDLALTQEQVEALKYVEKFAKKSRSIIIMTSNRGRGKSALLGLAVAPLMLFGCRRILVTAPACEETQVIFDMAEKGLKTIGEDVEREYVENLTFKLSCNRGVVEFVQPYRLLKEKAEVVFVDEAAGIQVPLLFEIAEKFPKVIFASTVHGYEGAGRGFSLRFLRALQQDKGITLQKIELKEPIRYAPNDPVEKWLYEALLLDAEPADLDETIVKEIKPEECKYERVDLDQWFRFDEKRLREFIGIYVLAHYRNRPDDLLILGDAPHHSARAVIAKSGEIIAALHIAEEGKMRRELIDLVISGNPPPGNLIPSCIIKYYPLYSEFARLKGIRIVRIAVHPELIGRGIGSLAIKNLCNEAIDEGFDWVGASFGADKVLLNFWLKNGFIPVHISPMRNIVSGEYSVAVIRPLSDKAESLAKEIYMEFKIRLLNSLQDTYFSLEPEVAVQLLNVNKWDHLEKPNLTRSQIDRLLSYVKGSLTYEGACDAIRQILASHFMSSGKPRLPLNPVDEVKLVARCLQCRSWDRVANIVKVSSVDLKYEMRKHVGALMEHYYELNI
ncbi:MAG: GNAT family N-acetyltransferase [Candidatus Bathyarchaeia archaeon]